MNSGADALSNLTSREEDALLVKITVKEKDIQKAAEQLMEYDGWRIIRCELNYSERKQKSVGEAGMPDTLAIRYAIDHPSAFASEVLWIEWKAPKGRLSTDQKKWHLGERIHGAKTAIAGIDFAPTYDAFVSWYRASGLNRGKV